MTAIRNKVKPDTVLKNFWRDNQRFADVFNTVLFNGKQVLKPEDLKEADTDISSVIKFNNHAETVQRIINQSLTMEERESEIDMCKALENLFNKGIEQGVIETKKETVFSLSKMGMPVEQIAQAVKIAVEDVQNWLQEGTQQ